MHFFNDRNKKSYIFLNLCCVINNRSSKTQFFWFFYIEQAYLRLFLFVAKLMLPQASYVIKSFSERIFLQQKALFSVIKKLET